MNALQIRQAIPYQWRTKFATDSRVSFISTPRLKSTAASKPIPLSKLQSKQIYWLLIDRNRKKLNIQPSCFNGWKQNYDISDEEWKVIFLNPFISCRSTKLQSFQYRLLHRVITCNHWLFKACIKPSPLCDHCQADDTIEHFFLKCENVKLFWQRFKLWWDRIAKGNYILIDALGDREILFGISVSKKHFVINQILIFAKKCIHDCKLVGESVSFFTFLIRLKNHIIYEREICKNKITFFEKHWQWILDQI